MSNLVFILLCNVNKYLLIYVNSNENWIKSSYCHVKFNRKDNQLFNLHLILISSYYKGLYVQCNSMTLCNRNVIWNTCYFKRTFIQYFLISYFLQFFNEKSSHERIMMVDITYQNRFSLQVPINLWLLITSQICCVPFFFSCFNAKIFVSIYSHGVNKL